MDTIEVGKSELAGRTFGVMQTMERGAGLQVIGFMNEVERLTGYRLTVNEGRRSRADQRLVWNAYALYLAGRGPWAPKAAVCYTSIHDEINHGNAVDFGGPGGAVIPANVHAVMVSLAGKFGVVWTGAGFNEWWHFEASRSNATYKVPEGTSRTGSVGADSGSIPGTITSGKKDDDMRIIGDAKGNIWVADFGRRTKWNIIAGLSSVPEAMQRLKVYQQMGFAYYPKQGNIVLNGFIDITNSKAA
jgi:hypothetical protein